MSVAVGECINNKPSRPTRAGADAHPGALTQLRYQRGQRSVKLVLLAAAGGRGSALPLARPIAFYGVAIGELRKSIAPPQPADEEE